MATSSASMLNPEACAAESAFSTGEATKVDLGGLTGSVKLHT